MVLYIEIWMNLFWQFLYFAKSILGTEIKTQPQVTWFQN